MRFLLFIGIKRGYRISYWASRIGAALMRFQLEGVEILHADLIEPSCQLPYDLVIHVVADGPVEFELLRSLTNSYRRAVDRTTRVDVIKAAGEKRKKRVRAQG